MGLTQAGTDGIKDDAISLAKMATGTDGQIITYDASGNPVAVGPGTDGQVLTSTGAGSPPAFEDASSGGATLSGSTDNTVVTVTGANAMQGEANLTFDGTTLGINNPTPKFTLTDSDTTGPPVCLVDGSGGDLDLEADINNAKNDSKVRIFIDGSEKIRFQTGGGISFNGDTAAANAIDDYEEGSWTPTVSGTSVTYQHQVGGYTKIGNMVYWKCYITVNGGSPTTTISGLPYAVPAGEQNNIFSNWTYAYWDWGNTLEAAPVVTYAGASSSNLNLKTVDWNGGDGFPNVNFGGGNTTRNLYAAGFYWSS